MNSPKEVVLAFWEAMQSNDFASATQWLADDFENYSPQSAELIKGRQNFAALNTNYPAHGRWTFDVERVVAEGNNVVTDVKVSDGKNIFRAITFHLVVNGLITKQTEYWPDDYPAPAWRSQWVEIVR